MRKVEVSRVRIMFAFEREEMHVLFTHVMVKRNRMLDYVPLSYVITPSRCVFLTRLGDGQNEELMVKVFDQP